MKTLKKALILGLSLLLVISAIPTVVFAETADIAAQTTTDGWTSISTPEQFLAIDDTDAEKTGNYYLTNDIDFGGETYESLINGFEGIIEGNGYALENFKLSVTSDSEDDVNVGVIGLAGKGYNTIIRNLRIGSESNPIEATIDAKGDIFFGFLVGYSQADIARIVMENVDIYGECTVKSAGANLNMGGAVGSVRGMICDNVNVDVTVKLGEAISSETDARIGGLWGCAPSASKGGGNSVVKNCSVDAEVVGGEAATEIIKIGGISGYFLDSVLIRECDVDVSLNGLDGASVGKIIGQKSYRVAVVVKDCGSFSGVDELVGKLTDENAESYFYAYDKASGSSTNVVTIGSAEDLAKISDNNRGVYRLTNDIYLGKVNDANERTNVPTEYKGSVVNVDFAGIFDGDGFTVDGFSVSNSETANAGFFSTIVNSTAGDAAVIDLTLGNAEYPVTVTSSFGTSKKTVYAGALCGTAGTTTPNYGAIISNVTAYTNVSQTSVIASEIGGLVGGSNTATFDGCVVYGSVTADSEATARVATNLGGIAGGCAKSGSVFVDCTNFARIETGDMPTNQRCGGILGYFAGIVDFVGCKNFGTIISGGAAASYGTGAGGIVAMGTGTTLNRTAMIECVNLGDVSAKVGEKDSVRGVAGGLAASLRGSTNVGTYLTIDGCVSLGKVSGVAYSFVWGALHSTENYELTVNKYNCSEALLTMKDGASVRLSKPAGIRFTAKCDARVLDILKEAYGEENISYGTMIAPKAYVSSEDVFTHADLDKYAVDNNLGDTPAYKDIPSNGNFKNVAGQIAGSLVGLEGMYELELTGRAYVRCGDRYFYADNTCVRTVKEVAQKALDDVIYRTGEEGDYKYYNKDKTELSLNETTGEYYYEADGKTVKVKVTEYTQTVETVDGYTKLSPYTQTERDTVLSDFVK